MSDCEIPEFYREHTALAKKQHRCVECQLPIYAGEHYEAFSYKVDGEFYYLKQHAHCADFCRFVNHKIRLFGDEGCTPFGDTLAALRDYGSEEALLLAWFFVAMASARNERFESGGGI